MSVKKVREVALSNCSKSYTPSNSLHSDVKRFGVDKVAWCLIKCVQLTGAKTMWAVAARLCFSKWNEPFTTTMQTYMQHKLRNMWKAYTGEGANRTKDLE